jgi:hypothetical protein
MEGLQRLVAESLARNGFAIPEPQDADEPAAVEMRVAASPRDGTAWALEPAPLPSGF